MILVIKSASDFNGRHGINEPNQSQIDSPSFTHSVDYYSRIVVLISLIIILIGKDISYKFRLRDYHPFKIDRRRLTQTALSATRNQVGFIQFGFTQFCRRVDAGLSWFRSCPGPKWNRKISSRVEKQT